MAVLLLLAIQTVLVTCVAANNIKTFRFDMQPGCEIFRRRWAIVAVAIFAPIILASCAGAGEASQGSAPATIRVADMDNKKKADLKDMLVLVRCKICVLELPVGTASASEELWNYLDEDRVQCISGDRLSLWRNGMRVGVARSGNWPEVAAILNRLTGRQLKQAFGIIVPGQANPIVLKENQPPQTIFLVNEDQTEIPGAQAIQGLIGGQELAANLLNYARAFCVSETFAEQRQNFPVCAATLTLRTRGWVSESAHNS